MEHLPIGIDLGTTFSAIAVFDPTTGQPQLLPNREGERLTPSAVYLTEDGEIQVGRVAISQAKRTPERVKRWVKREMGSDGPIALGDARFRPEEISAAIIAKLLQDGSDYLGITIDDAVITVPAYFDEPRRKATADAAAIAGLDSFKLLNEPTAAGLTFGEQRRPGEVFLVYDLGGGTFDVSVMHTGAADIEVLAVGGDHRLGGHDLDLLLAQHLAGRFEEEHGFSPDPSNPIYAADWHELMCEAEEVKKKLSTLYEAQATIRARNFRTDATVTRREFEELIAPLVSQTEALTLEALDQSGVAPEEVRSLVLVGGSTRIPLVREKIRHLLPHLDPERGVNPDEVVACGAAVRASLGFEEAGLRVKELREVTAHPYGVLVKDPETQEIVNEVLIPRNAPIPQAVQRTFVTIEEGQAAVEAKVTQGSSLAAEEVRVVAAAQLDLPPGRPPHQEIRVSYEYDEEGRMHCDFVDRSSGRQASLEYRESDHELMTAEEREAAREGLRRHRIV